MATLSPCFFQADVQKINKGMTSQDALRASLQVKAAKIGHAGTMQREEASKKNQKNLSEILNKPAEYRRKCQNT